MLQAGVLIYDQYFRTAVDHTEQAIYNISKRRQGVQPCLKQEMTFDLHGSNIKMEHPSKRGEHLRMFGSLLHLKSGAFGPLGLVESLLSWWLRLLSGRYNLHAAVYILIPI